MLFNRPREIERYKNDYKTLIDELHILKNKYQDKITLFDQLAAEYKKELNKFHKE